MKAKHLQNVKHVAVHLKAKSGVILASEDEVMKGFAIVLYRGKNYQMPHKLRPPNFVDEKAGFGSL